MTATNHALTGAIIGLTVHNPVLALPAALLSHLVCDVIPHFKFGENESFIASRLFRNYLLVDAGLCVALVAVLFFSGNPAWLVASVCAFLATSPDLLWIRKFIAARHQKTITPTKLETFLANIQWFQRPIGGVVEVVWFASCVFILSQIV